MDSVRLGKLVLPVAPGHGGAMLQGIPPCPTALSAAVNAYRGGVLKDLRRVLETGARSATSPAVVAARPDPELDLDGLRAEWESLTGLPAGDDVYLLKASWDRKPFLVPRLALLSLLDQLEGRAR
jgi:hypothetical protein